jgi:hypothetical protein
VRPSSKSTHITASSKRTAVALGGKMFIPSPFYDVAMGLYNVV